jgi:hypothetical protein
MKSHELFFCIRVYIRIFLLSVLFFALINFEPTSGNNTNKSGQIAFFYFNKSLEEQFKRAQVKEYPPDISSEIIISHLKVDKNIATCSFRNCCVNIEDDLKICISCQKNLNLNLTKQLMNTFYGMEFRTKMT